MRLVTAFALLCLVFAAGAQTPTSYDVTATMPATAGASSCQLYLDGSPVGGLESCDVAVSYPALLSAPGPYDFAYRAVNVGGQSALSPIATLTVEVTPPPADPTAPPGISVSCNPSPCPSSITITVTP